jgi:glycosyltransferase involved in cell wall biosynthesis
VTEPVRHLLVDARPIDHPTARQRGIGRYVTGLLGGLEEIDAPFTALVGSDREAELLADVVDPSRVRRWSPGAVGDRATPGTWYLATQLMLHPVSLDPIPRAVTDARLPVAAVMYDVIPYRYPERYQVDPPARRLAQVRAALARTVDVMLAISDFAADTAAEELDVTRELIATIGAGVEPCFVPARGAPAPRPDRVLPPGVDRYVVSVTGGDERKNTEGLLRAWGLVSPAVRGGRRLVIVGAHDRVLVRQWRRWAAEAGITDEVVFTGGVSDHELVALLQAADLAVMPSFEEGFGLPVLEAAACGCPVICSGVSSLPEVLDEPSAEFDPHDPAAIAAAIDRAVSDRALRDVLVAAAARAVLRWTWSRVATDTLTSLEYLGPRFSHTVRAPSRTIGLAGPFEDSGTPIGAFDTELASVLEHAAGSRADHGDGPSQTRILRLVDVSGTPASSSAAPDRWPVRSVGRYVKPWDVDHVVAALGGSIHHVATAQLATSWPCHVWLHDPSLVGLHLALGRMSGSQDWATAHMREQIEQCRADATRHLPRLADHSLRDPLRLASAGVSLLEQTLARARSVIVSSDRAVTELRRIRPGGPPALVMPLAHPPVERSIGLPVGREIVALGSLDNNKAPVTAVAALAALVRDHGLHDARLVFVGDVVADVADEVNAAARRLGVLDRISLVGRLDGDEYTARIGASRVGLQLRVIDRGEMSAAVADLVAHGVPTITNLTTVGPASPGMQIVGLDAALLADALAPLLVDDAAWAEASIDAIARAGAWTFDDVAAALLDWLADVDTLEPDTVRRVGPDRGGPRGRPTGRQ